MIKGEIANRYRIESRIGSGGMSTVLLAFDTRLERQVAVKLLAENLVDDRTFVSRFHREALAAARLIHPNVVQVFDYGLDEHSGRHFIVMEYVAGKSCATLLEERGSLDVDETISIVQQACRGLDYAHRHGVVHRDVKPGNLLVSNDGIVKLADFGIAKATEQSSLTKAGSVLGTAAYLAPEQARGEEAGPQADLYALGVVSYQLLSGRLPYEATSLTELALLQQREPPADIEWLNSEVSPPVAQAINRALAIDLAVRYPTAQLMERAFAGAAQGVSPDQTVPIAVATGKVGTQRSTTTTDRTVRQPRTGATRVQPPASARVYPPPGAPTTRPPVRRSTGRKKVAIPLIITLIILGLVVAGAIVAANELTTQQQRVQLHRIVSNKVNDTVRQLQDLINRNTR